MREMLCLMVDEDSLDTTLSHRSAPDMGKQNKSDAAPKKSIRADRLP
jgi:hypothetical protein